MILEYGQLLSTAHRLIDGVEVIIKHPKTGKDKSLLMLEGESNPRYVEHKELVNVENPETKEVTVKLVTSYKLTIDNQIYYFATHVNHPSAIWCRQSLSNYNWLANLLHESCKEYTLRYGKIHKMEYSGLLDKLKVAPKNISTTNSFTEPTPAMPDEYKVEGDSVMSYRNYYLGSKTRMMNYRNRDIPDWILQSNIGTVEEKLDKDSNVYKIYKVAL